MTARLVLCVGGVLVGLYGAYLLLGLGVDNLVGTLVWLVGGVVLHDGVLALATIAVVGLGTLVVPPHVRPPLAAAGLVIGTVTLTAVPVLGRFGARPDNPTLLDRDYLVGWLVLVAVVGAATVVAILVRGRRATPRGREG